MKTRLVEVREGEWLGLIDWGYDFTQHFASMGASDERKAEACFGCMERLRKLEESPDRYKVRLAHSCVDRRVLCVGMYDGWPFWKPTPAILVDGTLGPEVRFFYDVMSLECS